MKTGMEITNTGSRGKAKKEKEKMATKTKVQSLDSYRDKKILYPPLKSGSFSSSMTKIKKKTTKM
jgi:hypothetical protein